MLNLKILVFLSLTVYHISWGRLSVSPLKDLMNLTLFPNETTRIDLNEYFVGYKLNVSLENNTFDNATITQPFEVENTVDYEFPFNVFVADEEDPFLYTLDAWNTFRLFLKQNYAPTNILIGTPIDLSAGKPSGSIACQQVAKTVLPESPDIFYFIVDCNWQNNSSFQVIMYNSSEPDNASKVKLQAQDQISPSNLTAYGCNTTLLTNGSLVYRFCPLSRNPNATLSRSERNSSKNTTYYGFIEVYAFSAPNLTLIRHLGAGDMSLDYVAIESVLYWDQQLIIVDYGYGIYFIWNNNLQFSFNASHETYSEMNRLMDYRFETRGNFPENNILLLLRTDNYLSQLTITKNQVVELRNYNLNFDSVATDANIMENFIAVKAKSDTLKTDQFLKIYKRDNPVILFDLQDNNNVNNVTNEVALLDASEFFKTQDKIFVLYSQPTRFMLKICRIQSLFLEITATINVTAFTNTPPIAISVTSVSENTGLPYYSYNATISVAVIPSAIPVVYPEKQLNLTTVTSESDFEFPLAGTCKGPAMIYGWLVQPIKRDLINVNIKDTISYKANVPILESPFRKSPFSLSDLTNRTFIYYHWKKNDLPTNMSLLSIVWQQCENCSVYLIECWSVEKFPGNIGVENCTLAASYTGGSALNSLLIQGGYVYITFKKDPHKLTIFTKADWKLVSDNMTDYCDRIELRPAEKNYIYCFCYYGKSGELTDIFKIKGNSYRSLKNFSSLTQNSTKFVDTALLDDGVIVYRDQFNVYIDILWKKDDTSDALVTIHASSLQVYDETARGNFKIFLAKLRTDSRLVILDISRNKITEYSIFNPFQIQYRREYPLYDFILTESQPLFISGNDFFVVTANSSDHKSQYYLLYDPSKDSGSVLLYFDVIPQSEGNINLRNIYVPLFKTPSIIAFNNAGLKISLIEKNPYVYGSFNLDQPSSMDDPFVYASFAIKCVSFSYNLRKPGYLQEGSYNVYSTLQLQDRKVFLQRLSSNLTEFDFTDNMTQYQPIKYNYFSGPIEKYALNCSGSTSGCPYALKDFLTLNYEYTTYLNSTKFYGSPWKVRAINDTWVVLLSEYRISFISIVHGMEEMNYYDLRIFSLQCQEFYEARDISSIVVVCQKGTLSVNFLVFNLTDQALMSGNKLTPKLVELPQGVRYSKISRMALFDDLVIVLARQDINLNSNSLDIYRLSGSSSGYKFCLVKQIQLNNYRKAGDINIDHFYAHKFSFDDEEATTHLMITLQQPKAMLNLVLNITQYGDKYSKCMPPDGVYSINVWLLNPLDIPNSIMQYDAFEQGKELNPYDVGTEMAFVTTSTFNVNTMNNIVSCTYIIGTSQHTYILDTVLNFSETHSASNITRVYRKYTRCQNVYLERPLHIQDFVIVFCVADLTNTTHLLLYKDDRNCRVSDYSSDITECWPVQMLDLGNNAYMYSASSYSKQDKKDGAWNDHLLVTSYVSQFVDINVNQNMQVILKDDYFRKTDIGEIRTQLILEAKNFDRVTGGRAMLTVSNFVSNNKEDNYAEILSLIFYGFIIGCAIVLIYGSSKIVKQAIEESKKDMNKDMFSFLGKTPKKGKTQLEYEFS
mgnify:FL=1